MYVCLDVVMPPSGASMELVPQQLEFHRERGESGWYIHEQGRPSSRDVDEPQAFIPRQPPDSIVEARIADMGQALPGLDPERHRQRVSRHLYQQALAHSVEDLRPLGRLLKTLDSDLAQDLAGKHRAAARRL